MQLKIQDLSLEQKLWEFDFWVTPSLVDIRNTERFINEMARIAMVLDALSKGDSQEFDKDRFAASLVDRVFERLDLFDLSSGASDLFVQTHELLTALAALLFLVTGKSDNNNKCQFPIYLRNEVMLPAIPTLRSKKGCKSLKLEQIPRVLDSDALMTRISNIYVERKQRPGDESFACIPQNLLFHFVSFLLADTPSRDQLTAYLTHYKKSKDAGEDPSVLLTPLVMFQVRGSVAASGGHVPEEILRIRMERWGLLRGTDFNVADVILDVEAGAIRESADDHESRAEAEGRKKTRAYDFVLPFRTPTWHPMIFVQSQFYAGDSGSVSHKNVDQTSSSRRSATELSRKTWPSSPPPIFLEYVDGAGYSASLNSDLKSLLSFSDTAGFFQVRSASIRLRREFQKISFLTPLEVGHAILRTTGNEADVRALLEAEGYSETEINRVLDVAERRRTIVIKDVRLVLAEEFLPIARIHLLMDIIACEGHSFPSLHGLVGVALVPGYGPFYGLTLAELSSLIRTSYAAVWPTDCMEDLQNLCNEGLVVLR